MYNIDEEYDGFVHHLRGSAKGAESMKTTKRRLKISKREGRLTDVRACDLCGEALKEDFKERKAEVLAEAAEAGWSIRSARRNFANFKTKMTVLRRPDHSHDLTIVNTKFRKRDSHLISFYSENAKTQIDYVLVRRRDQILVADAKTVPYKTVATQHHPQICWLNIIPPRCKHVERCGSARIKWWRLKEKEAAVIPRIRFPTVTTVDETWKDDTDAITRAARFELGTMKPGRRWVEEQTWLWTDDVKEKVREKKRLYHYLSVIKQFTIGGIIDKRKKRQRRQWPLLKPRTTLKSAKNWKRTMKIIVSETEAALKKMKSGKATGPDDLPADLWKSKGWCPADWLTELFNQVVAEKKVPESWQQSTTIPN
ncbi:unnamed protein product [Heligmosomoides polygyrus]|uniref:DDE-1 domain-containing protein n=1 Tax=Heligmosomoides polygyrus TaxID=6339 RepID=A0A183FT13_HELPZ|nr:unnamed protein product [Heligmosomoides polygyrus]